MVRRNSPSPGMCLRGLTNDSIAMEALLDFTKLYLSKDKHRAVYRRVKEARLGRDIPIEIVTYIEYELDLVAYSLGFSFGQNPDREDEWGFYE
jgi:hypothetical protein